MTVDFATLKTGAMETYELLCANLYKPSAKIFSAGINQVTFLESKRSTATKCLDHLTLNHIIYNKLEHCNTSLLRYSCWCINGNSRPNNSRNNKKSPESVRKCRSYLRESQLVKLTVFSPKIEKRAAVKKTRRAC